MKVTSLQWELVPFVGWKNRMKTHIFAALGGTVAANAKQPGTAVTVGFLGMTAATDMTRASLSLAYQEDVLAVDAGAPVSS